MANKVVLETIEFKNQTAAEIFFRTMIKKYMPGDQVSQEDEIFLSQLFKRHLDYQACKFQSKTGAKQLYEWTDGLTEVVTRAKALKRPIRGLYLFCTRQGQPYSDAGFKAMWNRVQVKWADQAGQRFTFHDIRAKSLTDAKRMGMDAQSLAGHASSAMTEHYIKQREFKKVRGLK